MGDLRKKFIDILFEPDEEIDIDAPLTDVKTRSSDRKDIKKESKKEIKKEPSKVIDAREVLYGEPSKQTSFIDYFDGINNKKPNDKKVAEEEKYEMHDNVSPIFGLLNQKERKKKTVSEKEIQKAITPSDYISVVLSPIYGYDTAKANDARSVLDEKQNSSKADDAFDITDTMGNVFDDEPFEVPSEETREAVKEAVLESVIELNGGDHDFEEEIIDEVVEDVIEESVEEDELAALAKEVVENELIDDSEQDYGELYTTEITKEDIKEAFEQVKKESVINTKSLSLFDLDQYVNDDERDDFFEDLTGED